MALASVLGAITGVGVTCFKNGLCQLPVYRKPWEHVLAAMAGAAVFEYVSASEQTMVREIERRYAEMGGGAAAPAAAAAGGKK